MRGVALLPTHLTPVMNIYARWMQQLLITFEPRQASQARERLSTSSTLALFDAEHLFQQGTPGEWAGATHASPLPTHARTILFAPGWQRTQAWLPRPRGREQCLPACAILVGRQRQCLRLHRPAHRRIAPPDTSRSGQNICANTPSAASGRPNASHCAPLPRRRRGVWGEGIQGIPKPYLPHILTCSVCPRTGSRTCATPPLRHSMMAPAAPPDPAGCRIRLVQRRSVHEPAWRRW